jgi:hypothetical protein
MKKTDLFIFLVLLASLYSCGSKQAGQIQIANPSSDTLFDAQVIISRDSINTLATVSESDILLVKTPEGIYIPSQLDDINGDGQWDELAFVCNLAPHEVKTLSLFLVDKSAGPKYKARTQANFGKKIGKAPLTYLTREVLPKAPLPRGAGYPYKTDGPTWESDKAGYRHYFDGRNCRDFFCKRIPEMVLDTVGIWPDGSIGDTYHTLKTWGRDVLGVGQSFGLGGLALLNGDSLVRLGVLRSDTVDNSDSTVFTLVANGPVRSMIKLDFYGWEVGGSKMDVHQTISIWAGRYVYENQVKLEGDPSAKFLITGLVHNNDSNGLTVKRYNPGFSALITHDHQTYNRQYFMGLALLVPNSSYIGNFDTPAKGPGILYTYCAKLKAPFAEPLKFYAMAACEIQNPKFRKAEEFIKVVDREASVLNNPVNIRLIKIKK